MTYPYPHSGSPSQQPTPGYPAAPPMASVPPAPGMPPGPPPGYGGPMPPGTPPVPREPSSAPGVREYFARTSLTQRIALGLAVLGAVVLHLSMAFNWQTYTLVIRFGGTGVSSDGPISFGTLLTTDLEKRPIGGMTMTGSGPRPDYTSYSDVLAVGFLILSLTLLALVAASLMTRGAVQRLLRAGAGAVAALALACVVLIGIDLARLAAETEKAFKEGLDGPVSEIVSDVDLIFDSTIGSGLVLAAIACVLLGAAAGLNQPAGSRAAAVPAFAGPAGAPAQGLHPTAMMPGAGPVVFVEHPTAYQPPTPQPEPAAPQHGFQWPPAPEPPASDASAPPPESRQQEPESHQQQPEPTPPAAEPLASENPYARPSDQK